jgi:hypothetical protein
VSFTLDFAIGQLLGDFHGIWIDAKNLTDMEKCEALADGLVRHAPYKIRPMVELPSEVSSNAEFMVNCGALLGESGANVSYYVPTGLANQCTQELTESSGLPQGNACESLHERLKAVLRSGMFTDISFDWDVLPAVEALQEAKELTWNTWDVSADDYVTEGFADYGRVILSNQDPNHR